MPIKTFATSSVLSSSDVQTYLMNQAVITCTSGTHPAGPSTGMFIYETDTDTFKHWNGSAWAAFPFPKLIAAGAWRGTSWDGLSQPIQQSFTSVVTVGAAGAVTITYPTAFAHGIQSCIVVAGDSPQSPVFVPSIASCTVSAWVGTAWDVATSAAATTGASVRANVHAVGW